MKIFSLFVVVCVSLFAFGLQEASAQGRTVSSWSKLISKSGFPNANTIFLANAIVVASRNTLKIKRTAQFHLPQNPERTRCRPLSAVVDLRRKKIGVPNGQVLGQIIQRIFVNSAARRVFRSGASIRFFGKRIIRIRAQFLPGYRRSFSFPCPGSK